MPRGGAFCESGERAVVAGFCLSPHHFQSCTSGRSQRGWDSGDTSHRSVGRVRTSDVSFEESWEHQRGGLGQWAWGERSDVARSGKSAEKEGHAGETS